jgi:hypothetical protein
MPLQQGRVKKLFLTNFSLQVPEVGFKPSTSGLRVKGSTTELLGQNRPFEEFITKGIMPFV